MIVWQLSKWMNLHECESIVSSEARHGNILRIVRRKYRRFVKYCVVRLSEINEDIPHSFRLNVNDSDVMKVEKGNYL